MKRLIAFLLVLFCLVGCLGCSGEAPAETAQTTQNTEPTFSQAAIDALDGKKVLLVGNSYTYYGGVVQRAGSTLEQEPRSHDQGYFYQLCKSQGAEVSVTNWTFGDHSLWESLGHSCTRTACYGVDHLSYLTDRYFDYVVLQLYHEVNYEGDLNEHLQPMLDVFLEANPNVKFFLVVPHMAYHRQYKWLPYLEGVDREKLTVCNWGKMLHDIVEKNVEVPGAKQQYILATFVVSASETDGHHQNLLVGYLTAAMIYCAITGESAVGLPYDFCNDSSLDPSFNFAKFKEERYVFEKFSNFIEVYESPEDMKGLQQLIDQYLQKPFG